MKATCLLTVFLMILSANLTGCPSNADARDSGAAASSGSSSTSGGGY